MNEKKKVSRYTRQQLAESERYREQRDLILALLDEGKTYSLREADAALEKYRKGRVK